MCAARGMGVLCAETILNFLPPQHTEISVFSKKSKLFLLQHREPSPVLGSLSKKAEIYDYWTLWEKNSGVLTDTQVKDAIVAATEADAESLGYTFFEVDSYNHIPAEGNWVVALAYNSNPDLYHDYHWWRRGGDGLWSHKPGEGAVLYVDFSGNYIRDPQNCDRGQYNAFLGYFEVGPNKDSRGR